VNKYKPGQSFRVFLTSTAAGVLVDPSNSVVVMKLPDGSVTSGTPTKSSLGQWYADFLIPLTTPKTGIGVYAWTSSGIPIIQNGYGDQRFEVIPPAAVA
jgi:hypothetical protein